MNLSDLAAQPLITHPSGRRSTMHPLVLQACRTAGFEPDIIDVGETSTLVTFVAAGLGFSLVPASVRALKLDGVAYVPVQGAATLTTALALARRPECSSAAEQVVTVVRSILT